MHLILRVAHRVEFDSPFAKPPTVAVALAFLDHVIVEDKKEDKKTKPNNLRIKAEVREVDPDGFDFDLITWCNTDIHGVEMTWVAYGRSAP